MRVWLVLLVVVVRTVVIRAPHWIA